MLAVDRRVHLGQDARVDEERRHLLRVVAALEVALARAERSAPKLKSDPAGCSAGVDRGLEYVGPQAFAFDPVTGRLRRCHAWPRGPSSPYSPLTHGSRAFAQGQSLTVSASHARPLRSTAIGSKPEPLLLTE